MGIALVVTLAVPPLDLPSDELGLRAFLVPINGETEVSQTFTMTADGFRAMEFRPSTMGDAVSGRVRFELMEEGSGVVRSGDLPAASLIASPTTIRAFGAVLRAFCATAGSRSTPATA